MANSKDDLDRVGNRSTPPGSTPQDQQRRHQDNMSLEREQGANMTNQGRTVGGTFGRDSGNRSTADISRDSETRGSEDDPDRLDRSE